MKKKIRESDVWFFVGTICLIIGIIYFIFYKVIKFDVNFSLGLPCVFATVTHLYCPGCGGTRAIKYLLNFDIINSFLYQPLVLISVIVCAYYYIGALVTRIKNDGKNYAPFKDWTLWLILIIMILNVLIRNILLVFFNIDYIGDLLKYWVK